MLMIVKSQPMSRVCCAGARLRCDACLLVVGWRTGCGALRDVGDAVFLHLGIEETAVDAERFRGDTPVAAGLSERLDNHLPLDVGNRGLQRHAGPESLADVDDAIARCRRE